MREASASGDGDAGATAPTYTLEQIFNAAIRLGMPIAVWRLPNTSTVQAAVSFEENITINDPVLESSTFGFFFCPFQVNEKNKNLFIRADVFFESATGRLAFGEKAAGADIARFKDAVAYAENGTKPAWHISKEPASPAEQSEDTFKSAVNAAVSAIREEQMEKVVLSRNRTFGLPENFELLAAHAEMRHSYPHAFVSLVSVPGVGTWMGASPEILVSIDRKQVFRTVALAGTQPATEHVSEAIWRQKEIEEQAMVERYILNCFKKIRLREYTEIGPKTIVAGRLMHLRTDFKVDMTEVDFPNLGTDMLQLLHPTSAICGLPKEPALRFIQAYEGYDRRYYSGFLGPVNSKEGTHLYVNLRCMQLLSDAAVLFAGAGITGESSPEKEWQETQHKMQTMRRILDTFDEENLKI